MFAFSLNVDRRMEKQCVQWDNSLHMGMFNSYLKLPAGIFHVLKNFENYTWIHGRI